MWHLVCGDAAVAGVTFVLGPALAAESLRVMRDDLAVGPLQGIDTAPCAARSAYWQSVWPQSVQPLPDFAAGLSADADWLAGLASAGRALTVWHGDSCSEQLLLARLAQALEGSAVELWEVACGNPQLPPRRTVSLCCPAELVARYAQRRRLEPARRQWLASQWRQQLADNAAIRLYHAGAFEPREHACVDEPLLRFCTAQWQPLARAMAEVMARSEGFFATDFFLYWRARELAAAARLQLDLSDSAPYSARQVRIPAEQTGE